MLYDVTISGNIEEHGMDLFDKMGAVLRSLNEDTEINQHDTGFGFGFRDHFFFDLSKEEVDVVSKYYQDRLGEIISIDVQESSLELEELDD